MLEVGRRKAGRSGARGRLEILEHDLHAPLPRRAGRFDVVLAFHNVASLVADPAALARRLARAASPGGRVALVLPNLWQAAAKVLREGRPGELRRLARSASVRYADGVPEVLVFTPAVARRLLVSAGLVDVSVLGFPVTVHPEGDDEALTPRLRDPRLLRGLVRAEVAFCLDGDAAARGNNLLAIGRKAAR